MIPGFGRGGVDPRRMKKMMKQFGINIEELDDVKEVIIKTRAKDYIFKSPAVTIMTTQGEKTYQITGKPETVEKEGGATSDTISEEPVEPAIPDEDVKLVMDQTGASEEDAKKALEECDGNPAEAILKLMQDS
jgi:nascent polypeptide-associated complex subunit alpha